MNIPELKKYINTAVVGKEIMYFDKLESTNSHLYECAASGSLNDGSVMIANTQSKGRGRIKRNWISPEGSNLYMSVLLKPRINPDHASIFTFLASCALNDTMRLFGIECSIKWPNDILVNGKKISGVLTELSYTGTKVNFLVVGMGVNINMTANFMKKTMPDIHEKVTSIQSELGKAVEREKFTGALLNNIDMFYLKFLNHGNNSVLSEWTKRWKSKGSKVEVRDGNRIYSGIAESVDEKGFLYIRNDKGQLEKVVTGDLLF